MREENIGAIQIYTGNGKGKTTAALGLALRAAGHGMRTYIGQFLKGQEYGELRAVERLAPLITIAQFGRSGFVHVKEPPEKEDVEKAAEGLAACREAVLSGAYDIVIFDEICVALYFHLIPLSAVLAVLDLKPRSMELVLTGRYAPPELIDRADLVTEMREVKHYYRNGIPAREGIER